MSLDRAFASPDRKRRHVARLFTTIAPRYDLITRVLSYGQDRRWKRRLVRIDDARHQHVLNSRQQLLAISERKLCRHALEDVAKIFHVSQAHSELLDRIVEIAA